MHDDERPTLINQTFLTESLSPELLDSLLGDGWRHFGTHFFRYNYGYYGTEVRRVIPLRIRIADFGLSRNHRRIIKMNADLRTIVRPIEITPESEALFHFHKYRFRRDTPTSIYDFLSREPASVPCEGQEIAVYLGDQLVATSYLSIGRDLVSSVYAMFNPWMAKRSLGIYTLLKEIEYGLQTGKTFYYHGYAFEGESFYDYKKRFSALERFDWAGRWVPFLR